ncbi:hypothetical protein AWZ03_006215 [Drosophila navojoa]|uniref:Fucosyltransferase n=1 Tax=Drosophila navojoa TaxID=7232 RepID=A0A484BES7_DRONA|nr:alpha-(1,3)-fucosyltransferase C [Drosophila navojoa]TDG47356.1 hypothetical protein AWZ03_006215 [Drosophila navojoa]
MSIDRLRGMPIGKILSSRQHPPRRRLEESDVEDSSNNTDTESFIEIPPPSRSSGMSRRLTNSRNLILKWIICLSGIFVLLHFVPRHIDREYKYQPEVAILLWNDENVNGLDSNQCHCVITSNRNYTKLPIDAVVVNADRPYSMDGLDKVAHTPDYLVVYANLHPPHLDQNPINIHGESIFNYSMSYRWDSDLVWAEYYFSRLGRPSERVVNFTAPVISFMNRLPSKVSSRLRLNLRFKQYLAMYMQCKDMNASTKQGRYLMQMREHLELSYIDSCHTTNNCAPYKFMLIFESRRCPDYVHPHFYTALANFVVPVLIGGGNLSQLVPPGSYISDEDFHSPFELAQHLQMISSQPLLYEQFFWWHSKYAISYNKQPYCALCKQLRSSRRQRISVEFVQWWTVYQCPGSED